MAPRFGHRGDGEQAQSNAALQAEVERLNALSLPALAAEVMVKAFGPGSGHEDDDAVTEGGPNANSGLSVGGIASKYTDFSPSGFGDPSPDELVYRRLTRLIAEGLQQLEHASLIRAQMHSSQGHFDYAVTRYGRSLVNAGTVAQALGAG